MLEPARPLRRILGVGIIGLGTIGRFHLEAARRVGARIVAVAGRTVDRGAALAQEFDISATGDYRQLLKDPSVDVVHICTPNHLHYPMAREALLAGKHVICEKPLALTSTQSVELLDLAERSGLVHAVGFNNRFYPLVREAQARIARGDLGRPLAVRGFILEDSLLAEAAYGWRLDPAIGGESCAMSTIGCHLIDLVTFVLGVPITAVCADFTTVYPARRSSIYPQGADGGQDHLHENVPITPEEVANLLVQFSSGAKGVLGVSQVSAGRRYRISLEIDGTARALAWDSESPNQLWVGHDGHPNEITLRDPRLMSDAARPYTAYAGAYQEAFADTWKMMLRCVYRRIERTSPGDTVGNADFPTFADGHAALLVHEAVMESARSRSWVNVPRTRGAAGDRDRAPESRWS